MKFCFTPNLTTKGRLVRAAIALILFAAAVPIFKVSLWLGALLVASGVFVSFEALRGWCALRACGIKTRL